MREKHPGDAEGAEENVKGLNPGLRIIQVTGVGFFCLNNDNGYQYQKKSIKRRVT
jgi:hypothetical protein